ncbi:orotidine-5'-phosphate decarboxylase [Paramicrobacterium agarici]|uniref:Orotidine-5'-phosphate decarboxylase n=1 Tax=Paramicrobacterium agarici TaxID=630514 RepID=A0A2A9DZG6_9MICO|nr:orotidine-5'-phosphate decarboxylase [Microbacterium agarici]PFG31320.1 orotidine-5'-phosphate decarboxylase [Microbacterium agarici]
MPTAFGDRLASVFDASGRLCLGIDPHAHLLASWGLPDTADGAREFGLRAVDAAAASVGIVKPQVAFFERFGSAGYAALESVLSAARAASLLVIADVKRGEIGSSMLGYASAWLTPGSPLEADAVTLNPYLGVGALIETFETAQRNHKGAFVLAATSNPEATVLQKSAAPDGRSVASSIVADVGAWNAQNAVGGRASIGIVAGATLDLNVFGIDTTTAADPVLPVLAPGFGFQGARVEDASSIFGRLSPGVIVSESRSILSAGPVDIARTAAQRATEVRESFV